MKTVRKLSARSNEHFLRVVGQAAQSTRQAEIAREVGLSPTTVSRLLRTQEAREAVDVLRAQALSKSWEAFSELLNEALAYLQGAMRNPLVGHQTRARVALKLLELGLTAGAFQMNEGEVSSGSGVIIEAGADDPQPDPLIGAGKAASTEKDFQQQHTEVQHVSKEDERD